MRNRLISLNLAIALILTLFPSGVLAAEATDDDFGYATYYFNDGTNNSQLLQIGNFLASNCNLIMYDALQRHTPPYANHVLTGFSGEQNGGTPYNIGDIIKDIFSTDSANPGIIYAQWEEVSGDYVVYRCADGVSADEKSYIISSITPGEIVLKDGSTFTNTDGKIVVSWATGSGPDQRRYAPGASVSVTSGTEFMAVMGSNYITFHDGDDETMQEYLSDDDIIGISRHPWDKVFSGWNTKPDVTGDWYYPSSEVNGVPHDLYAQYVELPVSDYVILSSNLGFEDGPMAKVVSLEHGQITLPQQVKDQRQVAYWYSQSDKYYPAGISVAVGSGEELEAQVIRSDRYYGIIDGAGGLTAQGSPYYATDCYVTSAGNLNLYSFNDLVVFTKEGAAVSGYKGNKTGKIYSFNDDIWAAMGDEAESNSIAGFIAQYEELTGDYIQYLGNGAMTADNRSYFIQSNLDFSNPSGETYTQNPFEPPEGKYFLGWNTDQNGRGVWYNPGDSITLTTNTVLYAQWGKNRITYHYTDHRGQPATKTTIDGTVIKSGMSDIGITSIGDVYDLASGYGLRNYLYQDSPENYITRLDAAKIIVNLADLPPVDMSNIDLPFADCDELLPNEKAIVKAGVDAGFLSGTSSDRFSPDSTVARAQMIAMIWQFRGRPEPTQSSIAFTDVTENTWYYRLILSMLEAGIIITDREKFEPNAPATFLDTYRWAAAAYELKTHGAVQNSEKLKDSASQTFFYGWTTEESGSGNWYIPGDSISDGTAVELYENWIGTPTNQYYYVLTGQKMDNGRYTKIIELDNRTAPITLPSSGSLYGWFGGGLSLRDIAGQRGYIDETENFFICGEVVTVTSGDVFRPLSGIFAVYHKNDNSSTAPRTYFYITSHASLEIYGVDQVFEELPVGKEFTSWNTNAMGSGRSYTAGASTQDSLQLFAQWRDSGGSSSGGNSSSSGGSSSGGSSSGGSSGDSGGSDGGDTSSQPSTSVATSTHIQSGASITETTAAPTASISSGKATATVNTSMGNEIVKQAGANKSENVVITPKINGDVTKAEVSIPAATVAKIGSQTNANLTISTPVADVTILNSGLSSLSSVSGQITVTAEHTGKDVELTVKAGGKTVESVPGGLTVTVPVTAATPGTVAVLIHGDGTREVVRKSVAGADSVTIPLDGSAKLEIVDNSKLFSDVTADNWAADAVAFVSAHELFNGTGADKFSPNLPMSRGMLAVVLHNLESNPNQAVTNMFTDVSSDGWYAEGVAWAAANGIVGGYGNGLFGPSDNITREQLAVMLWRYAGSPATVSKALNFNDADEASSYALDALCWAVDNDIINGYGNGQLGPKGSATRAQVSQMLKNYLEK